VLATTTTGSVLAWGANYYGVLGLGYTGSKVWEAQVSCLLYSFSSILELTFIEQTAVSSGVVEAGAGREHSCLLDENQDVKCTGRDNYGQLGDGAGDSTRATFSTVFGLPATSTISVGIYHSCAMLVFRTSIWCWGSGFNGELGTGGTLDAFAPLAATEFNSGTEFNLGIANIQLVASWYNTYVDFSLLCP
jgi:alpha-tubulin suppressor-like RCC1 family protein